MRSDPATVAPFDPSAVTARASPSVASHAAEVHHSRMLRWRRAVLLTTLVVLTAACGLQITGAFEQNDAGALLSNDGRAPTTRDAVSEDPSSSSSDAAHQATNDSDAPPTDAGIDAADTMPQPPSLQYACNGTPVSNCAQCVARTLGCVYCGTTGAGSTTLTGLCIPKTELCFNNPPNGTQVCPCNYPNASTCPVVGQACRDYTPQYCTTCGDPNSDNSPCKQGGTCNSVTGTCD